MRINEKRLLNDLIVALNREMDKVSEILVQFMIGEINNIPDSGTVEAVGDPEWRRNVIDHLKWQSRAESLAIVKEIGLLSQTDVATLYQGFILDSGMGTLADTNNPWFYDYISSPYYHSERGGMEVYGRKGMQVFDPDTGAWKESNATHTDEIPQFRQKGSHFWTNVFGNSSILAKKYFDDAIERVINSINISDYLDYEK